MSEAPRRIAYVDHAEDLGGAEKSLVEFTRRLDRDRYYPLLLHTRGAQWLRSEDCAHLEKIAVFSPGGVLDRRRTAVGSKLLTTMRDLYASAGPVYRVLRGLRRHRAELVHTNTLKAHLFGGLAARLAHLPLIWHVRDLLDEREGLPLLRHAASAFQPRIIAISEAVAAQFEGLRVQVDVIPNGIPLESFTPGAPSAELRAHCNLSSAQEVIACVGRLTPWKGHRTLLRAFATVAAQRPQARLLVVGEVAFWADEYEQELHDLAQRLQLNGQVCWAGFRADVPEVLRSCDLLVLPSRNEPFGRVLIEAMAVGKAVVATNSGGAPEIVLPEETGLLVPPNDVAALAAALLRLLEDRPLRERLAAAGQARAREFFDVRRVVAQVQSVYQEMLGSPQESPALTRSASK
ncbi:MAG TPA: glycosyltransferase family 4 protein [Armatimonadota bacterium]|jgi:glycosyltransferase involved in cell wall biosynthesis